MHLVCSEEFTATCVACEFLSPEGPPTNVEPNVKSTCFDMRSTESRDPLESVRFVLFCRETVGEVDLHRSPSILILNVSPQSFPMKASEFFRFLGPV